MDASRALPYIRAYSHLDEGAAGVGNSGLISGFQALTAFCTFPPTPERDTKGKILCVFQGIGKFILLLGFLYFFVCSLDVLSSAFQLVGGTEERDKDLGWGYFSWYLVQMVTTQPALSRSSLLACFRTGSHLMSWEAMPPFYRREN